MTLLLDQNLSFRLKAELGDLFDEILHVSDVSLSGKPDREIWQTARSQNWVVMSKDGDFADMALLYGPPPKVFRLRIGNSPWRTTIKVVNERAASIREFLDNPESSLLILSSHPV